MLRGQRKALDRFQQPRLRRLPASESGGNQTSRKRQPSGAPCEGQLASGAEPPQSSDEQQENATDGEHLPE
jgi:hypothetical protein